MAATENGYRHKAMTSRFLFFLFPGLYLLFHHYPPPLLVVFFLFFFCCCCYSHTGNHRAWEKEKTYSTFRVLFCPCHSQSACFSHTPLVSFILNSSSPRRCRVIDGLWWPGVWPRLFGGWGRNILLVSLQKRKKKKEIGLFLNVVLARFCKIL